MNARMLIALFCLLLLTSCAIPHEAGIITLTRIEECGLRDQTPDYKGYYLRVTTDAQKLGEKGGAKSHIHQYPHIHKAYVSGATKTFHPLGVQDYASSAIHRHSVDSIDQSSEITSHEPNTFSNISVGVSFRTGLFSTCVPEGSIIGFIGDTLPSGWALLDKEGQISMEERYLLVSESYPYGQTNDARHHTHTLLHTHKMTNEPSDISSPNVQTFTPTEDGEKVVPIVHQHRTILTGNASGVLVSGVLPTLPSLRIAFIKATKKLKTIPRGGILLSKRNREPAVDWVMLQQAPFSFAVPDNLDGKFLIGGTAISSMTAVEANTEHFHNYTHLHEITLDESTEASEKRSLTSLDWTELAAPNHGHHDKIRYEGTTDNSSHIPPFTNLMLIIKTR